MVKKWKFSHFSANLCLIFCFNPHYVPPVHIRAHIKVLDIKNYNSWFWKNHLYSLKMLKRYYCRGHFSNISFLWLDWVAISVFLIDILFTCIAIAYRKIHIWHAKFNQHFQFSILWAIIFHYICKAVINFMSHYISWFFMTRFSPFFIQIKKFFYGNNLTENPSICSYMWR